MSVLNRSTRRLASAAAVGAFGVAIALGTTACGAGKISQTANQEPAVNGASGTIKLAPSQFNGEQVSNGTIAVRNVHVLYPVDKADKIFGDGGPFKLSFTIANDSPSRMVRLDRISVPTGSIQVTDPKPADGQKASADPRRIGPGQALTAGVPSNVDPDDDDIARFDVQLTGAGDTVAAGLTVPVTFEFTVLDLGGKPLDTVKTTVGTPVDGGTLDDRQDVVRDMQADGEH